MTGIEKNSTVLPELYSKKVQKGLVLNYAAFSYGIYVDLETNNGIELQLLLEYCTKFRIVCNLTESNDKWGEIYGNASDRGPLKWVANGDVDIALGGFYLQGRKLKYVDFVGPTIRLGITCIVPQPSIAINMKIVLQSFTLTIWLSILSTMIIIALLIELIIHFKKLPRIDSTFIIIAITLQQTSLPITKNPLPRTRTILIIFTLFTLIISAAYSSQLYRALTHPKYENVINTIQDLENSGFYWGAPHITYIESLTTTPNYSYTKLLSRFQAIPDDRALRRRLYRGKFGLLTEKLNGGFILDPGLRARHLMRFTVMSEDLFWIYTALMMHKHSAFYDSLQMHVWHIWESGLILFWENEMLRKENYQAQLVLQFTFEHKTQPLTIAHIQGILVLWFVGIVLASCQFFYERFRSRIKRKKSKPTNLRKV